MRPTLLVVLLVLALAQEGMGLRGALIRSGRSFRPAGELMEMAKRRYELMERLGQNPHRLILPVDLSSQEGPGEQPLSVYQPLI
ncbi:unnamed protein product, partial [Mesorhabditis spiculigera]